MVDATRLAAEDAGGREAVLSQLDSITAIRSFNDTVPAFRSPFGRLANAPWSIAQRIGANPREFLYPPSGGDVPQRMVTRACDQIASGAISSALIVGSEAQRTERNAKRAALGLDWSEDAPLEPDELGGTIALYSQTEIAHGMRVPSVMYALFEQALRARKRLSPAQRSIELGRLCASMAGVAQGNPLAARNEGYSAEDIATASPKNRYVGFPYTRLMTANVYVDQSAAIIVCSEAKADEWGVPTEKRVYLHGSAHGHDEWFATERSRFDRSPAINRVARETLDQSGLRLDQVSYFDLYSCFVSAIEVACDEIGIATDDPRGVTVTGGLSFFGGPGNNYVSHSIAEMVDRVRTRPGSYGMVTANGGLLTKHAAGVYSTTRPKTPWRPSDGARLQAEIDVASGPKVPLNPAPEGLAKIETYTVLNGPAGPERGVILGRLLDGGSRFVANTPGDRPTLLKLQEIDALGLGGRVSPGEGINIFAPDV
jgi:acetyl-CoA C-acetyltransferase